MLIEKQYPLDEVVFYDTGKEFQAIYNLRDKIKILLKIKNIPFKQLDANPSFDYKIFEKPVCKRGTKTIHKYGYSWCGGTCRWGTTDKLESMDRYCKNQYGKDGFMQYVGIAADEVERLEKEAKPYKQFPLAEWEMTESECLTYCYSYGYDWLEYEPVTDRHIRLYDILDRVSCWCCRNKNLKELRNIYQHLPSYWNRLKDIQAKLPEPMKGDGKSVFELEKRFSRELRQLSIFDV